MTMRSFKTFAMTTLAVLSLSFGATGVASADTNPVARTSYTAEQIAVIMQMRDNGDGLSDVAKVVGGTRRDVKAAESAVKASRKAAREGRTAGSMTLAGR